MRLFLAVLSLSLALIQFAQAQTPTTGNVTANRNTGALVSPATATFVSGNGLLTAAAAAAAYQPIADDSALISNFINLAAWGDSLTAGSGGTPYPTALATGTGWTVYNGGVGGETSTQIKTRVLADSARQSYGTIIWAGRNNYTSPTTVKSDIAAMVAALGHQRYLILGVINGDYGTYERSGGAGYTLITQLNTDLATLYGERFIDIRAYLISLYDSGDAQDVQDHADDIVPTSLRSDTIHLNTAGYAAVVAKISEQLHVLQGGYGPALTPVGLKATFGTSAASHGIANGSAMDALAAVGTDGFLVRTGASTYVARTITGTANQITVTFGTGVSGNPAISLPSGSIVLPNSTFYLQGNGNAYVVPGNGYFSGNGAGVTVAAADAGDNVYLVPGAGGAVIANGSLSSSVSLGYSTGAGGTVTQITSRTTGVTLDKICGEITLVSAAGSTSWQSFTVTNSTVAATDRIILNQKSGTDLYLLHVTAVGSGSFRITYATTGGTTTEQPVIGFTVIKSVTS